MAIFLRDGVLWVADFIDGEGSLVDAPTWIRFNCGALSSPHARRRMVLESAVPLSAELVLRISRLPEPTTARDGRAVCLLLRMIAAWQPRKRLTALLPRFAARERTQRED